MKANELMFGDWVYNKNIDKPMQVYPMMFSQMFRQTPDVTTEDYNIFPIPLTPEILEKNGFVPKFSDGYLTKYLIYKDIVDGLHEMYIRIAYFNTKEKEHKLECFDCRTGGCQIWIKFVHELQHALRLCGITHEIIL